MSGTVLVAGASGSLGQFVVRELHRRGWKVRALVRNESKLGSVRELVASVHTGDALKRASLRGAFEGVDAAFSCVGASVMPTLSGRLSFSDVDVPANGNLIDEAVSAKVGRFVYVSTHHTEAMRSLDYVAAHEAVVERLRASGLSWATVRPTGFFSALGALMDMAKRGVVMEVGDGSAKSNPIADEDLAAVCADALDGGPEERTAGGPEVLSRRTMAERAFEALGKPPRVISLPAGIARMNGWMLRPFHPRVSHLTAFFAALGENDVVGDVKGARTLGDHFRTLA